MINDHERRISHLEGKLDSLATKELVLQANAALLKEINDKFDNINNKFDKINNKFDSIYDKFDAVNTKIDQQTNELRAEIRSLDKRITDQDKKYTKLAGAAVAIGLILSLIIGAANAFASIFQTTICASRTSCYIA